MANRALRHHIWEREPGSGRILRPTIHTTRVNDLRNEPLLGWILGELPFLQKRKEGKGEPVCRKRVGSQVVIELLGSDSVKVTADILRGWRGWIWALESATQNTRVVK
jgi:hypothetical protein